MQHFYFIGFSVLGMYSRFALDRLFIQANSNFPWTTFLTNILGSFIAGLIYVLSQKQILSPQWTSVLLVGFCGCVTTFSAYSLQSLQLIEKQKYLTAIYYLILSPVLALGFCFMAVFIIKKLIFS